MMSEESTSKPDSTKSAASTVAFEKKPAPPRVAPPAPPRTPVSGAASTVAFEKGAPAKPAAGAALGSTVAFEKAPAAKPAADPALGSTVAFDKAPVAAPLAGVTMSSSPNPAHDLGLGATMAVESNPALSAPGNRYGDDALAATHAVDVAASSVGARSMNSLSTSTAGRTTVLPRVIVSDQGPQWGVDNRPRYETLKTLGEGGMGEVALVQDHDIDRKVALKKLRSEVQGTTALLRFAEEIKVIGQLEHPNIIPIHDVGVDETGNHYFVMKYVNGETLEQIIEKLKAGDAAHIKRFDWEHRKQVFISILQALRYAHAQGIIHRDIKPANIMVGPYGEVTVMDWGLAKKIRNADGSRVRDTGEGPAAGGGDAPAAAGNDRKKLIETQHGALLGTPLYMSPEQASGKIDALDERSDVYSLGVLFWEMLTLEHYLADQQSIGDVIRAITDPNPLPSTHFMKVVEKGVPAELNWFLQKAIEKDPAKRFQSIDEMVAHLEAIGSGEIVGQCGVTHFKKWNHRFMHWVDGHQAQFVTMLFVSTGLLALGILFGLVQLVRSLI